MYTNISRECFEQIQNKGEWFFPRPGVFPYPPANETSEVVPEPGPLLLLYKCEHHLGACRGEHWGQSRPMPCFCAQWLLIA